jgi:hypothetical protein
MAQPPSPPDPVTRHCIQERAGREAKPAASSPRSAARLEAYTTPSAEACHGDARVFADPLQPRREKERGKVLPQKTPPRRARV